VAPLSAASSPRRAGCAGSCRAPGSADVPRGAFDCRPVNGALLPRQDECQQHAQPERRAMEDLFLEGAHEIRPACGREQQPYLVRQSENVIRLRSRLCAEPEQVLLEKGVVAASRFPHLAFGGVQLAQAVQIDRLALQLLARAEPAAARPGPAACRAGNPPARREGRRRVRRRLPVRLATRAASSR
jgi:hypothetical protein